MGEDEPDLLHKLQREMERRWLIAFDFDFWSTVYYGPDYMDREDHIIRGEN